MSRWLLIVLLPISTMLSAASSNATPLPTKPQPSMISIDACAETCETDCKKELESEKTELQSQCEQTVTRAVADERRHYEPILAARTAERDHYHREADFWRTVAMVAAAAAVLGTVACGIFC